MPLRRESYPVGEFDGLRGQIRRNQNPHHRHIQVVQLPACVYRAQETAQDGNHKGLIGKSIGPLAVGEWEIKLYGYLEDTRPRLDGYAGNTENGRGNTLVYESKEAKTYRINSSTADWTDVLDKNNQIHVELKSPDSLKGYLEFGEHLTLTVPDGQSFHGGKGSLGNAGTVNNIKVRFIDVTDSANPVVIAESKTNLSEDDSVEYKAGDVIYLNKPVFLDTANVKTVVKDSVEHKYYPFDTTRIHNFVVVVEYMDAYSSGNNDYDNQPRYKDKEKGQFYELDYAPVGDLVSFPLKFTGGVSVTLSGDVNDIKANGGDIKDLTFEVANYAIVYWIEDTVSGCYKKDENKPPKYFSSLNDAVQTWIADNGPMNLPKHRITVLRDMNDVGNVETGTADVPVYPDGHFLDNLTIDGGSGAGGSVIFCVCDTEEENNYNRVSRYKISPYVDDSTGTAVEPVVKNINSKIGTSSDGTKVVNTSIFLEKGDCSFEALNNHTINLSGIARNVSVGKTEDETGYIPTLKLGTRSTQGCEVAELTLKGGDVELGGWTNVTSLAVDTRVASGSTLKGTTSAYVGNLDTEIRTGSILGSDLQKAVFKKVVLHGNNATSNPMTLYGIEGMYLSLLDFNDFSPAWTKTDADGTELVFMNWNTESNVSGSTVSNAAKVLMGSSDMELYAVWAQSLGGRVFYVNDDEGLTNYHFYGAQHNELMYWRNAVDKARELSAAAYVLNTSDTVKDKVYIAYTLTDPTQSVSAQVGLYKPTAYKWHTDYGTSASVPFKTDGIGKGKEYTNAVLSSSVVPDNGSLFSGIKALRNSTDGRGHKDWFIGSKAEYTKLYESGVPVPERITSLTENSTKDKVFEYCGDMYTPTWSEKDFGDEGKIAFLLPLRSV